MEKWKIKVVVLTLLFAMIGFLGSECLNTFNERFRRIPRTEVAIYWDVAFSLIWGGVALVIFYAKFRDE